MIDFSLSLSVNNNKACYYKPFNNKTSIINCANIENTILSNNVLVFNKKKLLINNNSNLFDILEPVLLLFPTISCSLSINGVYEFLTKKKIKKTETIEESLIEEAKLIFEIIDFIKHYLANLSIAQQKELYSLSVFLKENNWGFADFFLQNIIYSKTINNKYLQAWKTVEDFKDDANEISDSIIDNTLETVEISQEDTLNSLYKITSLFKNFREEQTNYASNINHMFNINKTEELNVVLAEAGTGTGKTIGYLSSILAFIKKNPTQQVLISTYSKALQTQIINELKRAFSNENEFYSKVSSIKGSNNYICLLNYKTLLDNYDTVKDAPLFLSIISRWLRKTKNGEIIGGDLSPIAFEIFANKLFSYLLNKKEECIYNKCPHFKNCFIMAAKYKSKNSNIIISNHTFSLLNSCFSVNYVVFDEAHHLFSTSDEVFSTNFSIISTSFLKVWIQGSKTTLNSTKLTNGIKSRLFSVIDLDHYESEEEQKINIIIRSLSETFVLLFNYFPDYQSIDRIKTHSPNGVIEEFIYEIYQHVLRHNDDINQYYSLESKVIYDTHNDNFKEKISITKDYLERILKTGTQLHINLKEKYLLSKTENKKGLDDFIKVFEQVCLNQLLSYITMLNDITEIDPLFIYRYIVDKEEGKITNIGYYKNYVDPYRAFVKETISNKRGVTFTSATLSDTIDNKENKFSSINDFGLNYLSNYQSHFINIKSPFDYKSSSKVIIINTANNIHSLSNSIFEIFKASKGGGVAVFTSINRLKQVYKNISSSMQSINIRLMAQHVNNQRISNLIDLFKEDENSCLLGTDSIRDGIDVPGSSLRIVIFEKVPWPKPDILLSSRVSFLGKKYIDDLIRLKLKQAFGRIIRTETDKGIFILLNSAVPSEFLSAFPEGVEVLKTTLEKSLIEINGFLFANE